MVPLQMLPQIFSIVGILVLFRTQIALGSFDFTGTGCIIIMPDP